MNCKYLYSKILGKANSISELKNKLTLQDLQNNETKNNDEISKRIRKYILKENGFALLREDIKNEGLDFLNKIVGYLDIPNA